MKIAEIRALSDEELRDLLDKNRKSLFEAKMSLALHQLEDTSKLRLFRHEIAQVQTVLQQKQAVGFSKGKAR